MRTPRFRASDLRRGLEKVSGWVGGGPSAPWRVPPPRLTRFSPVMQPWFGPKMGRRLNEELMLRSLRRKIAEVGLVEPVLVTTLPIAAPLVGQLGESRSVYYRVDDFSLWPGFQPDLMDRLDDELVRKVDRMVVSAEGLRRPDFVGPQLLLDHGVDLEHFSQPSSPTPEPLAEIQRTGLPIFLFAGLVDERVDPALLSGLPGEVVVVGQNRGVHLPGPVHVFPEVSYELLPAWLQAADVLLLPYRRNEQTDSIQPLKTREYLATGRPVVASALPELRRLSLPGLRLAENARAFRKACAELGEAVARPAPPPSQSRLDSLSRWAEQADSLLNFVSAEE